MSASELLDLAISFAAEAAALHSAPRREDATIAELSARRLAMSQARVELTKRVKAEILPLCAARPAAEWDGIDGDAVDKRWREAAGRLADRDLSEILT